MFFAQLVSFKPRSPARLPTLRSIARTHESRTQCHQRFLAEKYCDTTEKYGRKYLFLLQQQIAIKRVPAPSTGAGISGYFCSPDPFSTVLALISTFTRAALVCDSLPCASSAVTEM